MLARVTSTTSRQRCSTPTSLRVQVRGKPLVIGNEGYYICGGQVIRHHLDEAFILTGIVTPGRSNNAGSRHKAPEVVQSMRLRLQEDAGRLSGCLSQLTARSELLFSLADVVDEWQ